MFIVYVTSADFGYSFQILFFTCFQKLISLSIHLTKIILDEVNRRRFFGFCVLVPKNVWINWFSNLSTMNVHDEGFRRNGSCELNLDIHVFIVPNNEETRIGNISIPLISLENWKKYTAFFINHIMRLAIYHIYKLLRLKWHQEMVSVVCLSWFHLSWDI